MLLIYIEFKLRYDRLCAFVINIIKYVQLLENYSTVLNVTDIAKHPCK